MHVSCQAVKKEESAFIVFRLFVRVLPSRIPKTPNADAAPGVRICMIVNDSMNTLRSYLVWSIFHFMLFVPMTLPPGPSRLVPETDHWI